MSFGQLLRAYRRAAGFSQEHLAALARVSVESVGALERGVRRAPYRATIDQLAAALNLSTDEHAALIESADRGRLRGSAKIALKARVDNLPAGLSSFVGRGDDIDRITSLLQKHRLVTVTGSGGVGKTRVAIETARLLPDDHVGETWFVDLSPINDGLLIPATIASAKASTPSAGIDDITSLAETLGERRALLILDNCEHLIDDVARAAYEILQCCPNVTLLATSRERLSVSGEGLYRLPSLSLPSPHVTTLAEAREYSAIRLFLERAEALDAGMHFTDATTAATIDICRRLEGIPLAIELAVACLPSLGLRVLRDRLAESLLAAAPRRGMPQRQQTILATIAWSYELLSDSERQLFRELAIFAGGFTLEAAEAVCSSPNLEETAQVRRLSALVDKSLVTVAHSDRITRYTLLETVRFFGLEQLAVEGERDLVARRHAQWLVGLAERTHNPHTMTEATYVEVLPELDNVRAALAWCVASPDEADAVLAARIVQGLAVMWSIAGRVRELVSTCWSVLAKIDDDRHPVEAMRLLGIIASLGGSKATVMSAIERAIPLHERFADRTRLTVFYANLILTYSRLDNRQEAEKAAARAMELATADGAERTMLLARIHNYRALVHTYHGRFDDARADLAAAESIAVALGDVQFAKFYCRFARMELEFHARNYRDVLAIATEVLASEVGTRKDFAVNACEYAVLSHLMLGDLRQAEEGALEMLKLARANETAVIQHLATIAALRGRAEAAARLLGFIDLLKEREGMTEPLLRPTYELLVSSLHEQLPASEIADLAKQGSRYSLDHAVAKALEAARLS